MKKVAKNLNQGVCVCGVNMTKRTLLTENGKY